MCRVAFGRKYDGAGGGTRFKELLGRVVGLIGVSNVGDYIPWLAWINGVSGLDAKVDKVAKEMDEFLEGVVEEHFNRNKGDDDSGSSRSFLDVLLEIQRDDVGGCSAVHKDTVKALIVVNICYLFSFDLISVLVLTGSTVKQPA